jgi:hypothetical protein
VSCKINQQLAVAQRGTFNSLRPCAGLDNCKLRSDWEDTCDNNNDRNPMDKDFSNISREDSDDMNREYMPKILYVISKMLPGRKRAETSGTALFVRTNTKEFQDVAFMWISSRITGRLRVKKSS